MVLIMTYHGIYRQNGKVSLECAHMVTRGGRLQLPARMRTVPPLASPYVLMLAADLSAVNWPPYSGPWRINLIINQTAVYDRRGPVFNSGLVYIYFMLNQAAAMDTAYFSEPGPASQPALAPGEAAGAAGVR